MISADDLWSHVDIAEKELVVSLIVQTNDRGTVGAKRQRIKIC